MNWGPIGPIDIMCPIGRPGGIPGGGIIPDIIPGMPGITPGAVPSKPSGFARLEAGSSSSSEPEIVPETLPSLCLSCSLKSAAGIPGICALRPGPNRVMLLTLHSINFYFNVRAVGQRVWYFVDGLFVHLHAMYRQARPRVQFLMAYVAFKMLSFLMLDEDLLVFKLAIAVPKSG
jgi:hypothetical protein